MEKHVAAMVLLISCIGAAAFARSAEELHKTLQAEAQRLQSAGTDKAIIEVVRAQNARKVPLAEIQRIDKEWIAGGEKALVEKLTTNPCAERLRALLVPADRYNESFVMDNQGALVCARPGERRTTGRATKRSGRCRSKAASERSSSTGRASTTVLNRQSRWSPFQ